ncbi:MAG TPA: glutamate 5-kinase [Gaiellales bacterium]|nr:glutamate 5-kinase [Gaiellales bacterium]
MASRRPGLRRIVVVKVGSSTIVDGDGRARAEVIERLAAECAGLQAGGVPIALVSSGAVALGIGELDGRARRRRAVGDLQAASAVGQTLLQDHWRAAFAAHGIRTAQVLLTEADVHRRVSYVNARRTLRRLIGWEVVAVVNENDSTATDEITFGDNDALAAQVAILLQARMLVLLTDIDGVYDRDPALPGARRLSSVDESAEVEVAEAGGRLSRWGTGGIGSKVAAARTASAGGVEAVIASGLEPGALTFAADGAAGTRFAAAATLPSAYKLWLRHGTPVRGSLVVDDGARQAVAERGTSLLPVGLVEVDGSFDAGDAVELVGPDGSRFAIGVSRYQARELAGLAGRRGLPEAVRRDDLVLV